MVVASRRGEERKRVESWYLSYVRHSWHLQKHNFTPSIYNLS